MSNDKKIVVIDIDIPQLSDNKIFDRVEAFKISHTILPICYLYEEAKSIGIEMVTADYYYKHYSGKPALLVSYLTSPFTSRLIADGIKPVILNCLESPFIATRFYVNLNKISSHYKHSFVFSGMKAMLSTKTIYHQMFFPEDFDRNALEVIPFANKKFITMISGNKRIGNWKKIIIIKFLYGWMVKEIYNLRQEIINYFSDKGIFDLFGLGWENGGDCLSDTNNINKVYRGSINDKNDILKNYKFSFCFENSIFPGYVTEKIFDVMFAGSVPVYCGAPNIKDYVDKDCYIDIRDYKNFDELYKFLLSIDEVQYNNYIVSINRYLQSDKFTPFSQKSNTKEILNILVNEF